MSNHAHIHTQLVPNHEIACEVRPQLKFLEELDKLEQKRHEENEREVLLRAARSRSKQDDPEQLKLKEKAKAVSLYQYS